MRTILFVLSSVLLLCGYVFAEETETVSKQTTVTENQVINSNVEIGINQQTDVGKSAETSNKGNASNIDNEITEMTVEGQTKLDGSIFNAVSGVISINMAPGALNNQGNSVLISLLGDGDEVDSLLQSSGLSDQVMTGNILDSENSNRSNSIGANAFNFFSGVVSINQSSSYLNNPNPVVSLSIGGNAAATLSPAQMAMVSAQNTINERSVTKTDMISMFAFEGVSGIISINQSSGNMNNQVNIITISVNDSFMSILP
jgi:hypothetical protein